MRSEIRRLGELRGHTPHARFLNDYAEAIIREIEAQRHERKHAVERMDRLARKIETAESILSMFAKFSALVLAHTDRQSTNARRKQLREDMMAVVAVPKPGDDWLNDQMDEERLLGR